MHDPRCPAKLVWAADTITVRLHKLSKTRVEAGHRANNTMRLALLSYLRTFIQTTSFWICANL